MSIAFLLPDSFELLDVAGPIEVFSAVERASAGRFRYKFTLIALGAKPTCQGSLSLAPVVGFPRVNRVFDTVLAVGGDGALRNQSPAALQWLRRQSKYARRVGSICTGAFLLAQAGLLDGFRAVTHWAYCHRLAARFSKVHVDPEPIFIRDRNRITSAGVSAGIDLALNLVEEDCGTGIANHVARDLVLFLRRSGGQGQFSSLLDDSATQRPEAFRDLPAWVTAHLREPISVDRLARVCHMSARTFARRFVDEFGMTPYSWVQRCRVERARAHLSERRVRIKELARLTGFPNSSGMQRAFVRCLGVTPMEYSNRFGPSASPQT